MTDDRFWPPEPAPVRDPDPEITVITGLEGPVWLPVHRVPEPPAGLHSLDGGEGPCE
ncbi:hypothetical protein ACL02R_02020 [Streptomyces sp. MS19]|uniref:hypothetical protein n=1 Tax=Streptomyces sp. MS19 TaxID=3385972 RepID=UPI0039A2BB4B